MKITTVVVIIALVVVGMYALLEVTYFSSKIAIERDLSSPIILIPTIGVNEKINNVSISQGVYHEEQSYYPTKGEVVIFGHRTSYGSPFLRLNELKSGDLVTLQWPGIGEVNYSVKNSKVVPGSYLLPVNNTSQVLHLITCDPPGTTINRIIVEAEMTNIGSLDTTLLKDNPQEHFALYISIGFLAIGLLLTFLYPIKEDRLFVLIAILAISASLFYAYFFPFSPEIIGSKIEWLSGGL